MTKILSLIVGKLRREPVAVWGVVVAAVLGALTAVGVSSAVVEGITAALTLLGIPVVRSAVTPVAALKALITAKVPAAGSSPFVGSPFVGSPFVGEHGPEIANLPPGTSVTPAPVKDGGHSDVDTILLVLIVIGVCLLLVGVTLR